MPKTHVYLVHPMRMLDLPDGNVLFTDGGNQLYIYQPDGPPLAAGKPAITGITWNADGSGHLTGTGLNGNSQGASYGDDAQMDSNYPLIRKHVDSDVYYGRTYNWSSTSVMTGTKPATTDFTLPDIVDPFGANSIVIVANGISSDPVPTPVWVDFNSLSAVQDGSYPYPDKTLALGVSTVQNNGTIVFKTAGVSSETMTISKTMTMQAAGGPVTLGK